jgi:membrane fusion protein
MNLPLFRPEVVAARRDAWLGEARLVQPLSIRLVAGVCLFLIASFALYVTLGTYTRRVHAEGLLTPNVGLITLRGFGRPREQLWRKRGRSRRQGSASLHD